MERLQKKYKTLGSCSKQVHEDLNISRKYISFPQFFQLSMKKFYKMTKSPFPYDKFLSFIKLFPPQKQPF